MPSLTIGILNLNGAAITTQLLDQILQLPRSKWNIQLIVVDNGSTTSEVQHLTNWFSNNKQHFREAIFITISHNLGCAAGRNIILKLADCEAYLFLDNDVILPDNTEWLAMLWQNLQEDSVAIVGPMLVFADYSHIIQAAGSGLTDRGRIGYLHRGESIESVPATTIQVAASPSACWLVRSDAQREIGLFSEEFDPAQYEDVDFCVRLSLKGWKILCNRGVKLRHIEHVTTHNIPGHSFERLNARNAMRFREKWINALSELATIQQEDIYWGPIPRQSG